MNRETIFIIAVVVVGILALLNAYRGAVLFRSGDKEGGRKYLVLGLSMLLMIALANYFWQG